MLYIKKKPDFLEFLKVVLSLSRETLLRFSESALPD